jgi:hypothetical protein
MTWLIGVVVVAGVLGVAAGYVLAAVAMNASAVKALSRDDW